FKSNEFQEFLIDNAQQMLSWLKQVTFKNGDIPHFNDSTDGISFSSSWLFDYAKLLNIKEIIIPLGASGYRSVSRHNYECKIDFAALGATYQPGHAHADALSFILYYKNEPLFVEAGTSSYEKGLKRNYERSTSAHNTVVFKNLNQSEIWSGFRVGKRAKTTIKLDKPYQLYAEHDGYKKTIHEREFIFEDSFISIIDKLTNNFKEEGVFYLHVYPGIKVRLNKYSVEIDKISVLEFSPEAKIELSDYEMATGFNETFKGIQIKVIFTTILITTIKFLK
ncbi:MAG: heparinase II/III-family protein, partial [Ferruginibacter sp.]